MARNQALLRAVCGKLNLGILCAVMGASAFLESSLLLMVGMAAYFGLVARDVYTEERRGHYFSPRIPDGATFENMAIRVAIDAIAAAQKERMEAIKACPEDVRRLLGDILRSAAMLETAALRLAQRTDRLHGYMAKKDLACVRDTLYSSQQAAQLARSADERSIWESAAKSYASKVETLGAIDLGIRIGLAKLEHMRATLAVVPPRIVKLSAVSAEMADVAYVRLSEDLRVADNELQEAEDRIRSFVVSGGADEPWADSHPRVGGVRVAAAAADAADEVIELEEPARPARRAASFLV